VARKQDLHDKLKAEIASPGGGVASASVTAAAARGSGATSAASHPSEPSSGSDQGGKPDRGGPGFVHLHVHSAFSLLEGAMPLGKLIKLAVADGQPALAVTDRNNLFGALEFSQKAADAGLQPIMGAKLNVRLGAGQAEGEASSSRNGTIRNSQGGDTSLPSLVFLAMNETGYGNLVKLVSHAYLGDEDENALSRSAGEAPDGQSGYGHLPDNVVRLEPPSGAANSGDVRRPRDIFGPHVSREFLEEHSGGIICLTAGDEGPVNHYLREGSPQGASATLRYLKSVFGDRLYVELQRHGSHDEPREEEIEPDLLDLAYRLEIPIVATNQPYFEKRDDFEAHDALVCIAEGTVIAVDERRRLSPEHYFKSQEEMAQLFSDLPEALENTIEIARRCAYRSPKRKPILPNFASGGGVEGELSALSEADILREKATSGLNARMEAFGPSPGHDLDDYRKRLEYELGIIEQMGFPGYFLIVADFIQWAKAQGIPVGPGRGSGAGSLVAWALTITDLDPMRFSLLFERFLNPERVSMPDFDIDFCQDRREEVIRYVQRKYGRDQVAQIITFGTLQARAVVRDVGRVLQMPYGQVDRIAKKIPANPANPVTLKEALESEPALQEERRAEETAEKLFSIAEKLEGLYRHASTHAAGIVIGDRRLDELVPLYRDPRSDMPVTQFNMKWVEQAGLVKFDFLGLKTLTVLETAARFVRQRGIDVDIASLPIDDRKTYELLTRGETIGIFQLESAGMRKALLGMKPDRFEDIIALVALYRPGPMENIPVYNARKHGEEPEYPHPLVEEVLKETYGVIIYQEQVMQIAQILAGYSLGDADLLRRAMGKKIRAEMDKQRDVFVKGAVERGIKQGKANEIFDLLAKFADYGFNKSHAAAYALVSYHTAYLKAHFPVEFIAASMQLDIHNTDKLAVFRQEAKAMKIEVVAPSVAESDAGFSVRDGKIYYALAAIKGVGEAAVQHIVDERQKNGPYKSVTDFFSRIDIRQVNKRTIESLIFSGALDCFGEPRERIHAGLDTLSGHAQLVSREREEGKLGLFGEELDSQTAMKLPVCKPWTGSEKLQKEFQAVGFYLSAHPLDEYREMLEKMRVQNMADFERSVRAGAAAGRLAGTVVSRQERKTRTGKRMGIIMLSDSSGQYEGVLFEEGLNQYRDVLEPGNAVILLVQADLREDGVSIRIQQAESLEREAARDVRNLRIYLRDEKPVGSITGMLSGNSAPPRGDSRVSLVVIENNGEMEVEMMLRQRYRMTPQFASAIKAIPGIVDVELV
jgi:DNA polymerase-3 subunit alpha